MFFLKKRSALKEKIRVNKMNYAVSIVVTEPYDKSARMYKLVKLIGKNEEELNSSLTEKQKEIFEKT